MGKILFWLVVVFVVLFALRMINVARTRRRDKPAAKALEQPMVRCVQCGVFLPKPEARVTEAGYRCQDPACAARH
jgi:hypothetical protein